MLSLKKRERTGSRIPLIAWLSPVLMFALLLAGNISMWRHTANISDDLARNQSLNTAEQVALRLENLLQERTNDIALLAGLWSSYPEAERTERFLADATKIIEQEEAYHVINYVDGQSIIRVSAPMGKRPELIGLDLKTLPGREALHQKVRNSGTPMASPPMTLTTGRLGTVIWFPIPEGRDDTASADGMMAGTFHLDEIIRRAVTDSASDEFWVRIEFEGTQLHSAEAPEVNSAQRMETLGATKDFTILGRLWSVSVQPQVESAFARLPRANALRFGINVVLSLLASGLLGLAIVAISRVRKSKQRSQESKARLRDIFEAAENVSFIMTDLAGKEAHILEFSPGAEHIFGYSREEVIGKPVAMLHTPEDVARFPEVFEAIREEKTGFKGESTLVRKSGEQFPALLTTHPISDDRGDVSAAISVSFDISGRVRAEQALHESEERFRRAVLESPFPTMLHAEDGEVITINEAWIEITGYSKENISTITDWTEKAYGERKALVKSGIDQLYSMDRRIDEGEYAIMTSSGEERTWHFHSAPLGKLPDGRRLVLSIAADITEQKRAAEALRESEDRLSKTLLAANDGMWDWDLTTGGVYFDPRYYEMAGYEVDEFPHQLEEFQKRVHPDDIEHVMGQAQKHLEGEIDRFLVEFRFKKKDGDWLWIMGRGVIVERDKDGVPLRFVGTHTDITKRKRAEQALRESEERFRKVFEEGPLGMAVLSPDDRFIRANAALCSMTGYTEEELIGTKYLNITHAEDVDVGKQQAQQLLSGEIPSLQTEKRYITKEGKTLWINLTASFVRDDEGNPLYKLTMVEDITDRKRAEDEIQQRVRELTALNNLGRRVGATLSLEQVVKAALEEITEPVNPDLALLFLREGDELILQGTSPKGTPYAHQETPVHIVGECLCGLAVSERSTLYSTDIHSDPRCTWKECKEAGLRSFAALPMQSGDEIIGVLGLASAEERDFGAQDTFLEAMIAQITSGLQNAILHKQIQRHAEELEQRVAERTAELAAKNRELETFTYSVSHDLKAPLRGIDGYSRLLLEDHLDQLDEEGRMFLRTIRRATDRMHQLIEDLLTYSRLERRSLTTGRIDPQALVESLIAERAEEIEERGVRVTVDVPCAHVLADAEGLTQALRNLLENALKFTHETSEPQIEIGGRETEKSCILWVRDNGIGFDMKYHNRIFKIFERLHRQEDYPGTGVGLAIVHKALERIGGRTWAESKQGEGATFYLEIPR